METQHFESWLKRHNPGIPLAAAQEVLRLTAASKAAPYIAYYQKDAVQGLSLEQIYAVIDADAEWKEITHRQQHILQEVAAQNRLTDELKESILRCDDLDRLEDLYVPFKLKRQTLGVQAREAGLGKLADYLWAVGHGQTPAEEIPGDSLDAKATPFIQEGGKFASLEAVFKGVTDILVEQIAENSALRSLVRSTVIRRSKIKCAKGTKAKQNSRFTKFFEYQEPVGSLKKATAGFRYLMMRKGWMDDELVLSFERPDEGVLLEKFEEFACTVKDSLGAELLIKSARLALKGNVYTVMENEAHRYLKEHAEKSVTQSLAESFFKKLQRAPLGRKAVMGVDAGNEANTAILVLIDNTGKYLIHSQINTAEALADPIRSDILKMIENMKIEAIALAHGPRAKELRELFRKITEGRGLPIVSLHEHSASIYASSGSSKEEFPALEMPVKRAIFVARYLQDPMQTLLRLDSKYVYLNEIQHEINGAKLRQGLLRAMEAAVAKIGLDLNSIQSPHVLAKVPGLNLDSAKKILEAREKAGGAFANREALKAVLEDRFEFAAPFLRIENGSLDATAIHPNHYEALQAWGSAKSADLKALTEAQLEEFKNDESLKAAFGPLGLSFIAEELQHFGKDPRGEFEKAPFDPSLTSIAELKKEYEYPGVVTNVTSFGAFIDLGLEQDGLVHISELSADHKNPIETLAPGDHVSVWLLNINDEKKQISLTMNNPMGRHAGPRRGARPPRGDRPEGAARRPRRGPPQGASQEGQTTDGSAPQGHGGRERSGRDRFENKFRDRRPRREEAPPVELDPKAAELAAIKAKKKMQRDPKTGAIVKLDDMLSSRGGGKGGARGGPRQNDGPRVATKAKPHTFNPFANLGDLLKDKVNKS